MTSPNAHHILESLPIARQKCLMGCAIALSVLAGAMSRGATSRIAYAVSPIDKINNYADPGHFVAVTGLTDDGTVFFSTGQISDPVLHGEVHTWKSGIIVNLRPVGGFSSENVSGVLKDGGFLSYHEADATSGTALHSIFVSGTGGVTHLPNREGTATTYYYNTDGHGLFAGTVYPEVEPTTYFAGSVVRFSDGSVKIYPNTSFTQVYDDGWMVGSVQEISNASNGFITYKNRPTVWIKGEQLMQLVPSDDVSFATAFGVRSSDRSTMHGFLGISSIGGAAYLTLDGEKQYLNQPETHRILQGTELVEWFTVRQFNAMNEAGVAVGGASGQRFDHFTGSTEFYQTDGFAFRWDEQNGVQLLGDLIDPALNLRIDGAVSINNLGQIAVLGHVNQPGPVSYQWYLLNPVPEPSIAGLSGLAVLLASRRRRAA